MASTESPSLASNQIRRIFRLYNLYRLLIGLALVGLISSELDSELLNLARVQLFRNASWFYLLLNILIALMVRRPQHMLQVFSLALVDVILLSCIFYAAGGSPSGIGNLIIVAVAIANILLRGRIGLLIAAVAAIGMIYLTFYLSLSRPEAANQYVQAGALGALCFAGALFVQGISRRLQLSETLAEQRAADVANLEALNALILQRMRTGILVLDSRHRVLLANQAAQAMLGHDGLAGRPSGRTARSCSSAWSSGGTTRPCAPRACSRYPTAQCCSPASSSCSVASSWIRWSSSKTSRRSPSRRSG